jgi:hypothetical protein
MRDVSRSLEIVLCYEVGYVGFWLARLLTIVFDPASFLDHGEVDLARQIGLTQRR